MAGDSVRRRNGTTCHHRLRLATGRVQSGRGPHRLVRPSLGPEPVLHGLCQKILLRHRRLRLLRRGMQGGLDFYGVSVVDGYNLPMRWRRTAAAGTALQWEIPSSSRHLSWPRLCWQISQGHASSYWLCFNNWILTQSFHSLLILHVKVSYFILFLRLLSSCLVQESSFSIPSSSSFQALNFWFKMEGLELCWWVWWFFLGSWRKLIFFLDILVKEELCYFLWMFYLV